MTNGDRKDYVVGLTLSVARLLRGYDLPNIGFMQHSLQNRS